MLGTVNNQMFLYGREALCDQTALLYQQKYYSIAEFIVKVFFILKW